MERTRDVNFESYYSNPLAVRAFENALHGQRGPLRILFRDIPQLWLTSYTGQLDRLQEQAKFIGSHGYELFTGDWDGLAPYSGYAALVANNYPLLRLDCLPITTPDPVRTLNDILTRISLELHPPEFEHAAFVREHLYGLDRDQLTHPFRILTDEWNIRFQVKRHKEAWSVSTGLAPIPTNVMLERRRQEEKEILRQSIALAITRPEVQRMIDDTPISEYETTHIILLKQSDGGYFSPQELQELIVDGKEWAPLPDEQLTELGQNLVDEGARLVSGAYAVDESGRVLLVQYNDDTEETQLLLGVSESDQKKALDAMVKDLMPYLRSQLSYALSEGGEYISVRKILEGVLEEYHDEFTDPRQAMIDLFPPLAELLATVLPYDTARDLLLLTRNDSVVFLVKKPDGTTHEITPNIAVSPVDLYITRA